MHKKITMRKRLAATVAVMLAVVLGGAGLAWADFSNPREADGFNTYRWHQVCKEGAQHARATAYFVGAGGDCRDGELKMAVPGGDLVNNLDRRVDELESVEPEPGPQGEPGADGQDGVAAPETDGYYFDLVVSDEVQVFTAECSTEGKVALGGGFSVDFPQHRDDVKVVGSQPSVEGFTEIPDDPEGSVITHGWEIHVINTGTEPTSIRPWVVCADIATE